MFRNIRWKTAQILVDYYITFHVFATFHRAFKYSCCLHAEINATWEKYCYIMGEYMVCSSISCGTHCDTHYTQLPAAGVC